VPGLSHGYPEFITGCDAVAMGRETFLPALRAPLWPWGDMNVYVVTSRPLPPGTPESVVTAAAGPADLVQRLRSRGSGGDVHLVGGPRTIQALQECGALDSLEIVVLPLLLGEGVPLWPDTSAPPALRLLSAPRAFPDGSVELRYSMT
jgi:dihydrofolate reductase